MTWMLRFFSIEFTKKIVYFLGRNSLIFYISTTI